MKNVTHEYEIIEHFNVWYIDHPYKSYCGTSDGKYRYNKVSILQDQLSISINTFHSYSEAMLGFFNWVQ